MKKGLSSVVGAVLLILLVLVIAGIVFAWSRYTLRDSEDESRAQQICSRIEFVVDDFCYEVIYELDSNGNQIGEESKIRFNGRNDVSDAELYGFLFFLDYGGEIKSVSTFPDSELGPNEAKTLLTGVIENKENIIGIRIVPEVREKNNILVCNENDKSIDGGLEQCS